MQLSLMTINLTLPILLDEYFQPRKSPDLAAYEQVLAKAGALGFAAVDINGTELTAFGTQTVAGLLEKYNLRCASVIYFDHYTAFPPQDTSGIQQRTQDIIDRCAEIGCGILMLAPAGFQKEQSRYDRLKGLAVHFSGAVSYAREHTNGNVQVCIEDFPNADIPMSSRSDIQHLLNLVPGLGLVYDSANMLTEGENPETYFQCFRNDIVYYHLKDVRLTTKEGFGDRTRDGRYMITTKHGTGVVDFPKLSALIHASNYDGYLSVEYAADPALDEEPWQMIREEKQFLEKVLGIESFQKNEMDGL